MRGLTLALCTLFVSIALSQDGIAVKTGFLTAEEFMHMTERGQHDYSMGVVDGMLLAPMFGAPRAWSGGQSISDLGHCVTGMSSTQVAAIISSFVRGHPERWNDSMHVVAFVAMTQACSHK